jgi:hypothetical protein
VNAEQSARASLAANAENGFAEAAMIALVFTDAIEDPLEDAWLIAAPPPANAVVASTM